MPQTIADAIAQVRARIGSACREAGRPEGAVMLLAVSKTQPAAAVAEAADAGQRAFGENYVQEMVDKAHALAGRGLEWHFIGPLQSNKTRPVAETADWVHSVERLKIAERLSAQRPAGRPPLNVLVQVNVSGEASKSGCAPEDALELARAVACLPGLCLRGLMCIPEPSDDAAVLAARFGTLTRLQAALQAEGYAVDTLSMGMSADLEAAVAAGSTMVRVGTAVFGARTYPQTEAPQEGSTP